MTIIKKIDKHKCVILAILLSIYILIRIFLLYNTDKVNNVEPKSVTTIEIPKSKSTENLSDQTTNPDLYDHKTKPEIINSGIVNNSLESCLDFQDNIDRNDNPDLYGHKTQPEIINSGVVNTSLESCLDFQDDIVSDESLDTDTPIVYTTKNESSNKDIPIPDFDELIKKNEENINIREKENFGMRYYFTPKPIEFPNFQKDKDKAKLLEDYLKPSYSKEDFKFKDGQSEETIKEYLNSIEIPKEIKDDIADYQFKYKLMPNITKGYFVTQTTWKKIKDKIDKVIQNKEEKNRNQIEKYKMKLSFIEKVFKYIKTVKISEIPNEVERKQVLNLLLTYKGSEEDYGGGILNEESLLLDLRLLEFTKTDFENLLKTGDSLEIRGKRVINRHFQFSLCRDRMDQIIDYFESYGLIVPEELVDYLTGKFMYKPVLLDPKIEDVFCDMGMLENIKKSKNKINPYNRQPIKDYKYLNENDKADYDRQVAIQERKNEVFLLKIGENLQDFYIKSSQKHCDYVFNARDRDEHDLIY